MTKKNLFSNLFAKKKISHVLVPNVVAFYFIKYVKVLSKRVINSKIGNVCVANLLSAEI